MIDHIVGFAEKNAPLDFWLHDDPFDRPINNDRLRTVIQSKRVQAKPQFDFERDLLSAAETYDPETIAVLAKQTPDDFLRLFDAKSDVDLRKVIRSTLAFRKISNASPDMRAIIHNAEEALRIIAKRNAVDAFRVEKAAAERSSSKTRRDRRANGRDAAATNTSVQARPARLMRVSDMPTRVLHRAR